MAVSLPFASTSPLAAKGAAMSAMNLAGRRLMASIVPLEVLALEAKFGAPALPASLLV